MIRAALLRGLALLAVPLLAGGCSMGRTTTTSSSSGEGHSQSASISLHGSSDEAAFEKARDAEREGRYAEASSALTRLWESPGTEPEIREHALFELGELWSNVLNPQRDPARAAGYYRQFLAEYPDSARARDAEMALQNLSP